jgi:hypothetical protein
MSYEDLQVNTNTWSTSSTTTSTGKSNNDDLLNELLTTLGDFVNEMSPLFFLNSIQNVKTAIDDFGVGMSAALACVSVDLQVVASGLSSAAVAYATTDKSIADTFAHLDTQLAYYTNTATSTHLAPVTAAQQAQLNSLSAPSSSSSSSWFSNVGQWFSDRFSEFSNWFQSLPLAAKIGIGVGVVVVAGVAILVGAGVITVGGIVAAGGAIVAGAGAIVAGLFGSFSFAP